jgi:hypothetical protein
MDSLAHNNNPKEKRTSRDKESFPDKSSKRETYSKSDFFTIAHYLIPKSGVDIGGEEKFYVSTVNGAASLLLSTSILTNRNEFINRK